MDLPKISSYGQYSSENYGVNSLEVKFDTFTLYYSYDTIIAFKDYEDGLVVRKNDWSTTTGKHLNWLDGGDKKSRLDSTQFNEKLQAFLERHIV